MAIWDMFTEQSDEKRFGLPPPVTLDPAYEDRLPKMDGATNGLHQVLPRGTSVLRAKQNREQEANWATALEMEALRHPLRHRPCSVRDLPELPLGQFRDELIGYNDDRCMITLAPPRAGKSSTVLEPILLTYPGSMFVFDPAGELAEDTALHRHRVLKQKVCIVDPFRIANLGSDIGTASFNIFDELDAKSPRIVDDIYNIAQAIVVADAGEDSSFWVEGGRQLLAGVLLSVLLMPRKHRNLLTVLELVTGASPILQEAADKQKFKSSKERHEFLESLLLREMATPPRGETDVDPRLLRIIQGVGNLYANMPEKTRGSMIATAATAMSFMNSLPMQDICKESHFRFADLRNEPTTIYLILPGGNEIGTHYRWLRLMFETATSVLMRMGRYPDNKPPMLFMIEEFPVLGTLKVLETSVTYLPKYGIKLHLVAQNLSQIKRSYPKSWDDFFSSAGVMQFFATNHDDDLEYISKSLGEITFERERAQFSRKGEDTRVSMRLISPHEIRLSFARDYNNQIVLIPGRNPLAIQRLTREDVAQLRANVIRHGVMSIRDDPFTPIGFGVPDDPARMGNAGPVRGLPRRSPDGKA